MSTLNLTRAEIKTILNEYCTGDLDSATDKIMALVEVDRDMTSQELEAFNIEDFHCAICQMFTPHIMTNKYKECGECGNKEMNH